MRVFFRVFDSCHTGLGGGGNEFKVVRNMDRCTRTEFLAWCAVCFDLCRMSRQDIHLYSESGILDRDLAFGTKFGAYFKYIQKNDSSCLRDFNAEYLNDDVTPVDCSDSIISKSETKDDLNSDMDVSF